MRKIRETLRLSFDHELSQHEIARAIQAGQPTVHDYLTRFRASGLSWPLPDSLADRDLEQKLFPPPAQKATPRSQPDFARIEAELKRDHVTLDLLWREYREAHPEGYSHSRYCFLYERWKASQGVVMRQEHKAGEKCFVDAVALGEGEGGGLEIPLDDAEAADSDGDGDGDAEPAGEGEPRVLGEHAQAEFQVELPGIEKPHVATVYARAGTAITMVE